MPPELPRGGGGLQVGPGVQQERQLGARDLRLRGGGAAQKALTRSHLLGGQRGAIGRGRAGHRRTPPRGLRQPEPTTATLYHLPPIPTTICEMEHLENDAETTGREDE